MCVITVRDREHDDLLVQTKMIGGCQRGGEGDSLD